MKLQHSKFLPPHVGEDLVTKFDLSTGKYAAAIVLSMDESPPLPPERGGPAERTASLPTHWLSLHTTALLVTKGPLESERGTAETLFLELLVSFPLGERHTGTCQGTCAIAFIPRGAIIVGYGEVGAVSKEKRSTSTTPKRSCEISHTTCVLLSDSAGREHSLCLLNYKFHMTSSLVLANVKLLSVSWLNLQLCLYFSICVTFCFSS